MTHEMNINRFHEIRSQAFDVQRLRDRAANLATRRPLRTFDGFGHFLDAVLGDDNIVALALANTAHLPLTVLEQLRASDLDPFADSVREIAFVGYLLGIDKGEFLRLAAIDSERFAQHSDSVLPRSAGQTDPVVAAEVEQLWARFSEDRATSL